MTPIRGGRRQGAGAPRGMRKSTIDKRKKELEHEEARRAAALIEQAHLAKRKLAREVLEEFMFLFAGMAAHHQPPPPGAVNLNENEEAFRYYAGMAVDTAAALAQYQSPKFRAVVQMAPPTIPEAKTIEGKVTRLDDQITLAQVYRRLVTHSRTASRGK